MICSIALDPANPARIASAPEGASEQPRQQILADDSVNPNKARDPNSAARLSLLGAGLALAAVSIALAALAGWSRGASTPESVLWATAGAALAVVSLVGLSVALTSHGPARRAAYAAWVLSLAFTVVAALGSQHGGREFASRLDSASTGDRTRLEADHKRATDALALLPAARPSGVINEELATHLKDARLADCRGWLESKRLRTICVMTVEPLRTELATAKALEAADQAATEASAALATLTVTKPANTDATAVARYLAAVGIVIGTDRLADVISLLTVLAVEVVGAVAIALGRAQSIAAAARPLQHATAVGSEVNAAEPPARNDGDGPQGPDRVKRPSPAGGLAAQGDAERRRSVILEKLKTGALVGTQESIAGSLGLPKTTMRRLVEADSRLRLSVGPDGSRLELAMP